MGRIGYLILVTLLVAGALYVFWPAAEEIRDPPLWQGDPPKKYRVIVGGLTQEVDGEKVLLDGIERPLDRGRHTVLWSFVQSLTVNERFAIQTPEDRLADYGIDSSRELAGNGQRLRWGGRAKDFYIWDGKRVVPCGKDITDRMDSLATRLDRAMLFELTAIRGMSVDRVNLRLDQGAWRAMLQSERPDFNRRVNRLFDLLEKLRLEDLSRRTAPLTPPLHEVRLSHQEIIQPERLVRLWAEGDGAVYQVDDLPVQQMSATELQRWKEVIATFNGDYLFNLEAEFSLRPLGEIRVQDADGLRFRLEKHGLNDVQHGRSQWDVVWPGGREAASEAAAALIAMMLDDTAVRDPRRRQPGEVPPSTARRLTFVFKVDQRTLDVFIDGDQIWSPTHVATAIKMPELLRRLVPDDMLDQALTLRGAERVVKIQRQWHQGPEAGRAEVVAVAAGSGGLEGQWRRTYPKNAEGTVSPLAIDRLARAFCTARSHAVRLPTAADRAILAAPAFEIDVRFAQAQVRLSNDHTRLSDTTDQDIGFAFAPEGGRWRAVEKESGISHLIDGELMDLLQAPLSDDLVLPLVPSQISRIEFSGNDGRYALNQRGDDWQVQPLTATGAANGDPHPADVIEVRRYLRLVTSLRSIRTEPTAGPFTPDQLTGSVVFVYPGIDDASVRVTLNFGQPRGDELPLMVDSTGLRSLASGRQFVSADQQSALSPQRQRFMAVQPVSPTTP